MSIAQDLVAASARLAGAVDRWRARPRGLRPEIPNPDVNRTWFYPGWGTNGTALPFVTEPQVLGIPAAGRAVRLIANAVASMAPPRFLAADGRTELLPTPPVITRPNATYGVTEWWRMCVAHYLVTGNLVAILADPEPLTGWPRQVVPINSSLVHCYYDDEGRVRYDIGSRSFGAADVVHVRAFTIPGNPWGVGVVDAYRRSLGLVMDQRDMAAGQYQQGGIPSGILKPGLSDFSATQTSAVQERWIERFSGGGRKPAVIPDEWSFTPLAWSPEDMEFLQSRSFSVAEVALMFDLDPTDLSSSFGASSSLTYANLTQRQTARVVDSYGPHIATFEDAWSDLVPGGNLVRFQRSNYLHASRSDLFDEQAKGIEAGILTVDEARQENNLAPLPPSDASSRAIAETAQKVYLAVGPVLTRQEARDVLRGAGAQLSAEGDDPEPALPVASTTGPPEPLPAETPAAPSSSPAQSELPA